MKKAHLSIWQVSELSGTPVSTLRDHRYRGEGLGALGFRLDGRIIFDRAEVEEYIANAKRQDRLDRHLERRIGTACSLGLQKLGRSC